MSLMACGIWLRFLELQPRPAWPAALILSNCNELLDSRPELEGKVPRAVKAHATSGICPVFFVSVWLFSRTGRKGLWPGHSGSKKVLTRIFL